MKSFLEALGLPYPAGEGVPAKELEGAIAGRLRAVPGDSPIARVRAEYMNALNMTAEDAADVFIRQVTLFNAVLEMDPIATKIEGPAGREAVARTEEMRGLAWQITGEHGYAAQAFKRALDSDPTCASARVGYAESLEYTGRSDLSLPAFRIALHQFDLHALCERVLNGNPVSHARVFNSRKQILRQLPWAAFHDMSGTTQGIAETHRLVSTAFEGRPQFEHANDRQRERPLRVGYLVGNYVSDPLRYHIQGLLENHDDSAVRAHVYATGGQNTYRSGGTKHVQWQDFAAGDTPLQIAENIHDDKIDVLVNACGHFQPWTMEVLAHRPAPIQAVYGSYPGPTGLPQVDYLFADRFTVPPNQEKHYDERILRLRQFCTLTPIEGIVPLSPAPVQDNDYVTFGSFHRTEKLNPQVIALWARILQRVPKSRLRLQRKGAISRNMTESVSQYFRTAFKEAGIDSERLEFHGGASFGKEEYLHDLSKVDIALDPSPYNGHTITGECMYMGVPVLTKRGATYAGNLSASLMYNGGLRDYVTEDDDAYVDKAVELARRPDRIRTLRGSLRDRLLDSCLCNGAAFARDVERAYRVIWERHLDGE